MSNIHKMVVFIFIVFLLTACNAESDNEQVAELEVEIERLTKELEELKGEVPTPEQENENKDSGKQKVKEKEITLNESITIEGWAEFTLNKVDVAKRYHATKNESFSFEVEQPDNMIIDAVMSVKNLQTTAQSTTDLLDVKVIYDDKYEYKTLPMSESKDGTMLDILRDIDPLLTGVIHYNVEVPEEFTTDNQSIVIEVSAKNKTFLYRLK